MSAILAAILVKIAPWLAMGASVVFAYFGVKGAKRHAANAEDSARVSILAAQQSVAAQKEVTDHVSKTATETLKVTNSVSGLNDASVSSELLKDWNRDAPTNSANRS